MDNRDFDNKFKEELNNEMDFNFQEEDWKAIEDRVRKPQKKNRPLFFWLALGSICLGILLSGVYLLKQQNVQKHKIEALQENFKIEKNSLQKDTVFVDRTIIVRDTIIKYITEGEDDSSSSSIISKLQSTYSSTNSTFKPAIENIYSESESTYNFPKSSTSTNSNPLQQAAKNLVYDISPSERLNEPVEKSNYPISKTPQLQLFEKVKSKEILLQYIRTQDFKLVSDFSKNQNDLPKFKPHFLLGPTYSYSSPENYSTLTDSISKSAHSTGLKVSFAVNKRFSITGQIAHEWLNYTMPKGGMFTGTPPLEDRYGIESSSAFVKQKRWQYLIGGNYKVFVKNKASVYLSAQIETQSNLSQLISRSFEAAYVQDTLTEMALDKSFRINSIVPGLGINYQINDHCTFQVEPWLRINLSENKNQMYQRFGIRTTLLFR